MPTWIIEPRDPLIVRDGRPFGPTPGARATSLSFPFPSTTTGGVRTRIGPDAQGAYSTERIDYLKSVCVRGPLLVELKSTNDEDSWRWLVPAPADALLLEPEGAAQQNQTADSQKNDVLRKRLVPLVTLEGLSTNLPAKVDGKPLHLNLVGQVHHSEGKPIKRVPAFWHWEKFEQWLLTPPQFEDSVGTSDLGHSGPALEARMHVSIEAKTQTADEGKLFQTRGLEFTLSGEVDDKGKDRRISQSRRLALAVVSEGATFEPCIAPLGGERRMVRWRKSDLPLPDCQDALVSHVQEHKACRVILLTPACFAHGWYPTWWLAAREGVQPTLSAAAIQRPQVVSGWSLEKGKRGPKPTRRLAPAGSVFFLTLAGDKEAIARWVRDIWMQNISDDEQDRRDGFGLAVVGTWDGTPQPLQMKEK